MYKLVKETWANSLSINCNDINPDSSYFELGGSSLKFIIMLNKLLKELKCFVNQNQFIGKTTFKEFLLTLENVNNSEKNNIEILNKKNILKPLSFSQSRLWFIDQLEGVNCTYNMSFAYKINGVLNVPCLEESLLDIVERHETLRTSYNNKTGVPILELKSPKEFILKKIKFSNEGEFRSIGELVIYESQRPFVLSKDIMFRAVLITNSEDNEYILLFVMHHIASDGWSIAVFLKELNDLYLSKTTNKKSGITNLEIQYSDYALWQNKWLVGNILKEQLNYWLKQLKDIPCLHSLPLDKIRPERQRHKGEVYESYLNKELIISLKNIAKTNDVTLFMVMQTTFSILLSLLSNEDDIVMGTPISGRNRPEISSLIGFFVNTIVLRNDLSKDINFSEQLKKTKINTLDAFENQDIPFEMLVKKINPKRNLSYSPIFQILFSFQDIAEIPLSLTGIESKRFPIPHGMSMFDLSLQIGNIDGEYYVNWNFNIDIFDKSTIEKYSNYYILMLNKIVNSPGSGIREILVL